MRKAILALLFSLIASSALAQSGTAVKQSGNITPNTVPAWFTNGVIGGGVTSADSPISSFGVTNNGGNGICVNSDRFTSAAWQSLCFSIATTGQPAKIIVQNHGTAPSLGFEYVINGTTITPAGGITNVTVGSTSIGNGTSNCLLFDSSSVLACAASLANGMLATNASGVPSIASLSATVGVINPKNAPYNAACDTFTDDTTPLTSALADAISTGRPLFIPGQCSFSGTLNITGKVQIYGAGTTTSNLIARTATQSMFNVTTTDPIYVHDLQIGYLNGAPGKTGGYGFQFSPAGATQNNYSVIKNVLFRFQYNPIVCVKCAYFNFSGNFFDNIPVNSTGITIANTTSVDSGDGTIAGNTFLGSPTDTTQTHVTFNSGGGLRLIGNKFFGGNTHFNGSFAPNTGTGILFASNNNFDQPTNTGFSMTTTTGSATIFFTNVVLTSNIFDGSPSNAFVSFAPVAGGAVLGRVSITGNDLTQNAGTAPLMRFVGGSEYIVTGNSLLSLAGPSAGISFGSAVVNSLAASNILLGVTYLNNSSSTTILDTGVGTSGALTASFPGGFVMPVISAPATPATAFGTGWFDSTAKRWHDINDAGAIGTTVVADTGAANNFLTAISAGGAVSKAQPSAANLSNGVTGSGAVALAASPVFTGSVVVTPTVVNSLPTCNPAADGARAFVTNNNTAVSFGGAVTTGGTTHSPVYCDGSASAWKQG